MPENADVIKYFLVNISKMFLVSLSIIILICYIIYIGINIFILREFRQDINGKNLTNVRFLSVTYLYTSGGMLIEIDYK